MTQMLADRVALVTGAQQGIGRAAAAALAREGADVALNWLDDLQAAEAAAQAVRDAGRRVILLRADMADIAAITQMVDQAAQALGRLDILVNNAGIYPRSDFLDLTEAIWDSVQNVNLKASVFCAQAAARVMIAGKAGGSIISMCSQAVRGAVQGAHYSASKAGLIGFTRSAALELAPYGIRVNAIAPGLTDTAQPRFGSSEQGLQEQAATIPLGRMALPREIADAAVFLASDRASFITGEVLQINGGAYMA